MENKEKQVLTGYPHIDRMWTKYYDEEFLKKELPTMKIYDYMKKCTFDYQDSVALSYYSKKITYAELYENIDNASRSLSQLGVNKDDRILYLLPNIPETAYLLYGTTQIGAVADYIDPRPDSIDMKISAKKVLDLYIEEKAKYVITLDQCYLAMIKPIERELKNLGLDSIIIISASDSMNLLSSMNYLIETANFEGLKQLKSSLNHMNKIKQLIKEAINTSCLKIVDYKDLVRECKNSRINKVEYEPNKLDVIVHTSGTSSPKPKPIPLTNDNLNSYVHQTFGANMTMSPGDKALHMLPYFAAFGIVDVAHAGLCHANNLIQIPQFSPSNFGKLIKKYTPQTIIGAPTWFLNLIDDKSLNNFDLGFLKMITYGGDTMDIKDELKINEFLKFHNCNSKITKGHGMSETCGCASYATLEYNIPETMGIPMPNMVYALVNPITRELLRFEDGKEEIEGELIISGPTVTSGELDGKKIVEHSEYDGLDFISTRDIAKMNRNGIMSFLSRSDRSFTRFDGFKIKPYEIEKLLKEDNMIKYCIISPYLDEERKGNMAMATIVLENGITFTNDEKVLFVEAILDKYFIKNPNVSSRQIPTKFKFKDQLPKNKNGKLDYNLIINEGITGEEVTVELEETNISIENIKVISPNEKKYIR